MKTILKKFFFNYDEKMKYVQFIFDKMKEDDIYYFKDNEVEVKRTQKAETAEGEGRRLLSI